MFDIFYIFFVLYFNFMVWNILYIFFCELDYCSEFYHWFWVAYPKNLNWDHFLTVLVYGYVAAFFSCRHPPFAWFYPYLHTFAFCVSLYTFLNSKPIILNSILLDLYYVEPWFYSWNFKNHLLYFKYFSFKKFQWNIFDSLDILISRICLIILVFFFFV